MNLFVGLLPALILGVGALLGLLPLPFPPRFRRWISILACGLAAASLIILARAPEPLTLFPPNEALPALALTLQWNGPALMFGLLMLSVLCGRLLIGMDTDSNAFVFGALASAGGALLFFAADNFTTIAAAWIFVELGLLVVPSEEGDLRESAGRAFGWNLAAIVLWLTAGMIVSNLGSSLRLTEVALEGNAAFLVLGAIWIRSGIYPFQVAAPVNATSIGVRLGLPLLLGGYLLTRFMMQRHEAIAFGAEMQILALLAVGASALIVVGQLHGGDALTWTARAFGATMLLLPFFINTRMVIALSVWFALAAFIITHFIEIAMQWRAEIPRLRLTLGIWIVALIMFAALPLAPTFWVRVGLLSSSYATVGIFLWLLLVATMALLLIPIWREIFASGQVAPKAPTRYDYAGLALVLLPALALGVLPFVFVAPFGNDVQAQGAVVYDALFKPSTPVTLIFLLAGLVVPLLASFELARRWTPRANLLPMSVTSALDLSRLTNLLARLYHLLRALVQQALTLLEQPPIAWLMFLIIWVAIWVFGLSG